MQEIRNVYGILVGKPEGKRPLGRPRCRWEGKRVQRCELDVCGSGQGSMAGSYEHSNEPLGLIKSGEFD
jgi:hypothetical protein